MIANNIEVIVVVIMSFLIIFGFVGAPGSVPFTTKSLFFCELIKLQMNLLMTLYPNNIDISKGFF